MKLLTGRFAELDFGWVIFFTCSWELAHAKGFYTSLVVYEIGIQQILFNLLKKLSQSTAGNDTELWSISNPFLIINDSKTAVYLQRSKHTVIFFPRNRNFDPFFLAFFYLYTIIAKKIKLLHDFTSLPLLCWAQS